MKFQRWGDQQQPRRLGPQRNARKIAVRRKLAAVQMPFDANPIVESLQRQVEVRRCLQFKDGQAAGVIHRQQVHYAAISARECRHLPVYRRRMQSSIQCLDLRPCLRFEPCLRLLAIEWMLAIFRTCRSHAVEFLCQAHNLRQVVVLRGPSIRQSKDQAAPREFREFDTAHAEAGASIVLRYVLYSRQGHQRLPGLGRINGLTAKLQVCIQVAVVKRIDARYEVFRVYEKSSNRAAASSRQRIRSAAARSCPDGTYTANPSIATRRSRDRKYASQIRPNVSTAAASPSDGHAMAAQPCWPWRRKARGNAGERLYSRFASALSSARFHSGNWRRRNRRKRSRNTSFPLRWPISAPARRERSSRNSGPSRFPKRSTHNSRRAGVGSLAAVTRRVRFRVRSQACRRSREPRTSSSKFSAVMASNSSPGSSRAGSRQFLRKPSMTARISTALRPPARWEAIT